MASNESGAAGRWDAAMPRYREAWRQRQGGASRTWEEDEPAYRHAFEARSRPEYRQQSFAQAEPALRRDWEQRYPDRPWDRQRASVQHAWGAEDQTVQLREEQLVANKERVQTGEVEVGKRIVEEKKTMEVPVSREEVVVERRPVNQPTDEPIGTDNRTIRVPVTEERVNVEKRTVVTEEIGVDKRVEQETVPVSGTVRREEAVVDTEGDVHTHADRPDAARVHTRWQDAAPGFRQHWQENYAARGGAWEQYEPAYRYGYEQQASGKWSGKSWREAEPELRRDWESRNPGQRWDVASNPVKHAWDHLSATPHTHR